MRNLRARQQERGGVQIEFVLVSAFFFVPLIVGTLVVGFSLIRLGQTIQTARDVGHMWVRGVDFSQQGNQDIVTNRLTPGMGMQGTTGSVSGGTSGNGVVVLSIFTKVPATCSCTNSGHIVVMRRIVIGNHTLFTTTFGSPASINATTGDVPNFNTDTTARADNVANLITMNSGDICYLSESAFTGVGLSMPGIVDTSGGLYARAVF